MSELKPIPIMTSSAQRVFSIPELLEDILLLQCNTNAGAGIFKTRDPFETSTSTAVTEIKHLYVLRSVSRAFKEALDKSPHLRRRMLVDYYKQIPDAGWLDFESTPTAILFENLFTSFTLQLRDVWIFSKNADARPTLLVAI